ncbi:MAG: amino acid permease, partial [bacterium]
RTLLGSAFQFGFHYTIAGYDVYFGELFLAVFALLLGAFICLHRKLAERTQILMAVLLFVGVVICFVAAMGTTKVPQPFTPAFDKDTGAAAGTMTIFALAPWAYVGFESITHSAAEAKFSIKKSFRIMAIALVCAGAAYALLALLAVTALPEGCNSWLDYIGNLDSYEGVASQPTFFAAHTALGDAGSLILGIAALGAIFTGLIGNFIALSRLVTALSEDGIVIPWLGETDENHVPRRAILIILCISVVMPFFGRTAISWIVDVTTVGATIAYAFASAAAWKTARKEKNRFQMVLGIAGLVISLIFALEFLVPNLLSVNTLATESYLILAIWGVLGFIVFRWILKRDVKKRIGRSTVSSMVLLGLIIFTSSVWMRQATERSIDRAVVPIQGYYVEQMEKVGVAVPPDMAQKLSDFVSEKIQSIEKTMSVTSFFYIGFLVLALVVMFDIYAKTQQRERQTEIEKAIVEDESRAKTSFLSNMSHEIRTPLNAIIGLDRMALRSPELDPKTRDQLERIGASAKHLLGLINDILDMSRIESGRMVLKNEEFYLKELVNQVSVIVQSQCMDKGITYICKVSDSAAAYYYGDDMKLKQILINILGNSVKFTAPPGEVSLIIEQTTLSENTDILKFQMRDTGIGMDEEYIPKIFEAFSQEDMTNTKGYGGTGLGMAITKKFVEMMEGEILVESKKGVGSVFTVTVPLRRSSRAEASADTALPMPAVEAASADLANAAATDEKAQEGFAETTNAEAGSVVAGKRVLIAEDVELNAEILADLLELEEIESEVAANGQIALDLFKEKPEGYYDAILMDMRMPVLDGLSATRAIRALGRPDAKKIPIIAMTANVFEEDIKACLAAGMNAHLGKPIDPEALSKVLGRFLANA